jgi:hypothetical protein
MTRTDQPSPASPAAADPSPLVREKSAAAALLKTYAAWTRPGERSGVAAWYRLADQLDPATRAVPSARFPRSWLLSAALTATFGIFLLARSTGLPQAPADSDNRGGSAGQGGTADEARLTGAGGSRGASGAHGAGGTAAVTFFAPRAG